MPVKEKAFRSVWVVVPSVGFMTTAVIPSVTAGSGYERVLSAVHNLAAPLSMLFCMLMETIQLSLGEQAFAHIFTTEDATHRYGALSRMQRIRVVTIIVAWCFGATFVAVQGYLFFRVNKSFTVALTSYISEIFGLSLAFLMPALAGVDACVMLMPSYGGRMETTNAPIHTARHIIACYFDYGRFFNCGQLETPAEFASGSAEFGHKL